MLKLRIIQAKYGDCFLLAYGQPAAQRHLLIDGGPRDVYRDHLRDELRKLHQAGTRLDLVVLSHVDTDHLIGLLDFFAELKAQQDAGTSNLPAVDGLWFNSFEKALDQGSGLTGDIQAAFASFDTVTTPNAALGLDGIGEGNKLRIQALLLQLALNDGFPNDLVCVDDAPAPIAFGNLKVRVVGPTRANLDELRDKWRQWLDDHQPAFASGDPNLLANADTSIPNLSSIMLHVEADEKTILFTGDGRSDHLLQGLEAADLLDAGGNLHVDVLKVAHHGSNRNTTKTFHRKVTADTYVISANEHPDNPDLDTLRWIVETARDANRPIRIMATNKTRSIRKMPQELPAANYTYQLDVMLSHYHYWDLLLA